MTAAMSQPYDPVAAVVDALREEGCHVQPAGRDRYTAQCPAHDDRDPSLSVARGTKGEPKAVLHCHAGCGVGDVLEALHLDPRALFANYTPTMATVHHLNHIRAWNPDGTKKQRPKPAAYRLEKVAHYDYVWPDGTPCARVVKFLKIDAETGEISGKKAFSQQRWTGATYTNGLDGLDVPVYRADQVAAAVAAGLPVMVCEGEKDAETATAAWGFTATTNPMGAGSWRPHHTEALAGAQVILVADNDQPGRSHATEVAAALRDAGANVLVRFPAHGKDLTDHIDAGGTFADLIEVEEEQIEEDAHQLVRDAFPALDWHELWADDTEEEWILEPILPARRLVAIYSAPKVGKSLLILEIAVGISKGAMTLGVQVPRPFRVLYVDFENDPKGDIRARLQAMGYGPDDLQNLYYLSFPTLAALDSPAGAEELLAAIAAYDCEVVVIDTVSRAVKGDENENDTWLAFYRNTGLALKQAKVALIRLDHSGKDETKGQRGGSAKSGDVDAIWRMSKISDTVFSLECEAARLQISEKQITLHRETAPHLRHRVDAAGAAAAWNAKVTDLIAYLDSHEVPNGAGEPTCREAMKKTGRKGGSDLLRAAMKARQARLDPWEGGAE